MTTFEAAVHIAAHVAGGLAHHPTAKMSADIGESREVVTAGAVARFSYAVAKTLAELGVSDDQARSAAFGPLPEPRGAK